MFFLWIYIYDKLRLFKDLRILNIWWGTQKAKNSSRLRANWKDEDHETATEGPVTSAVQWAKGRGTQWGRGSLQNNMGGYFRYRGQSRSHGWLWGTPIDFFWGGGSWSPSPERPGTERILRVICAMNEFLVAVIVESSFRIFLVMSFPFFVKSQWRRGGIFVRVAGVYVYFVSGLSQQQTQCKETFVRTQQVGFGWELLWTRRTRTATASRSTPNLLKGPPYLQSINPHKPAGAW